MDQLTLAEIETISDTYVRFAVCREEDIVATVIINANGAPANVRVFKGGSHEPAALVGRIDIPE